MVAAGVTFSLMKSCARGENNRCPCIVEHVRNNRTQRTCKENLDYALKRAKRVMRGMEVKSAPNLERKLFNVKNLKAGIKVSLTEPPSSCKSLPDITSFFYYAAGEVGVVKWKHSNSVAFSVRYLHD